MHNVKKKTLTLHIKAVLKSWDLNSQNSQPEWPYTVARSVLGSYSLYLFPGSLFNLYPTFHSETLYGILSSPLPLQQQIGLREIHWAYISPSVYDLLI